MYFLPHVFQALFPMKLDLFNYTFRTTAQGCAGPVRVIIIIYRKRGRTGQDTKQRATTRCDTTWTREKSFEHKRQKLWVKESREKGTSSSPARTKDQVPTLGPAKSFRVKLELELKAQPGKGKWEGEARERGRKGWRNWLTQPRLTKGTKCLMICGCFKFLSICKYSIDFAYKPYAYPYLHKNYI